MGLGKKDRIDHSGMDIELGKDYRCKITGFVGRAVGTAKYLSGCDQVLLQPQMKPGETEYPKGVWIDDNQLVAVETETPVKSESRGGPRSTAAPSR